MLQICNFSCNKNVTNVQLEIKDELKYINKLMLVVVSALKCEICVNDVLLKIIMNWHYNCLSYISII